MLTVTGPTPSGASSSASGSVQPSSMYGVKEVDNGSSGQSAPLPADSPQADPKDDCIPEHHQQYYNCIFELLFDLNESLSKERSAVLRLLLPAIKLNNLRSNQAYRAAKVELEHTKGLRSLNQAAKEGGDVLEVTTTSKRMLDSLGHSDPQSGAVSILGASSNKFAQEEGAADQPGSEVQIAADEFIASVIAKYCEEPNLDLATERQLALRQEAATKIIGEMNHQHHDPDFFKDGYRERPTLRSLQNQALTYPLPSGEMVCDLLTRCFGQDNDTFKACMDRLSKDFHACYAVFSSKGSNIFVDLLKKLLTMNPPSAQIQTGLNHASILLEFGCLPFEATHYDRSSPDEALLEAMVQGSREHKEANNGSLGHPAILGYYKIILCNHFSVVVGESCERGLFSKALCTFFPGLSAIDEKFTRYFETKLAEITLVLNAQLARQELLPTDRAKHQFHIENLERYGATTFELLSKLCNLEGTGNISPFKSFLVKNGREAINQGLALRTGLTLGWWLHKFNVKVKGGSGFRKEKKGSLFNRILEDMDKSLDKELAKNPIYEKVYAEYRLKIENALLKQQIRTDGEKRAVSDAQKAELTQLSLLVVSDPSPDNLAKLAAFHRRPAGEVAVADQHNAAAASFSQASQRDRFFAPSRKESTQGSSLTVTQTPGQKGAGR